MAEDLGNLTNSQLEQSTEPSVVKANQIFKNQKLFSFVEAGTPFKDWILKVNALYEKTDKSKTRERWLTDNYEDYTKKSERNLSFIAYVTRNQNLKGIGKNIFNTFVDKLTGAKDEVVVDNDIKPKKDNTFLGMKPQVYIPVGIVLLVGIGLTVRYFYNKSKQNG